MSLVGVICEYNPFHNGHAYQLRRTRELLGEESTVVCAMSGDFVQRGDAAVYSKFARAEAACRCGADLVIELPLPWALSSAEGFARGAVGLLAGLGVQVLSFGSETGDLEALVKLATLLNKAETQECIKEILRGDPSFSYAAARQKAAEQELGASSFLLKQPNNILAVEYLKAIQTQKAVIRPLAIERIGGGHDEMGADAGFRSASEIRSRLRARLDIRDDIPEMALAVFQKERDAGREVLPSSRFEQAVLARLLMFDEAYFEKLPDAEDGLGRRFYRAVQTEKDLEGICFAAKTKRYTLARIRRLCMCACLGVERGANMGIPPYARVLAFNDKGQELMHERKGNNGIPILTKAADVKKISSECTKLFTLGAAAHDFYSLGFSEKMARSPGEDWRTGPKIVQNLQENGC